MKFLTTQKKGWSTVQVVVGVAIAAIVVVSMFIFINKAYSGFFGQEDNSEAQFVLLATEINELITSTNELSLNPNHIYFISDDYILVGFDSEPDDVTTDLNLEDGGYEITKPIECASPRACICLYHKDDYKKDKFEDGTATPKSCPSFRGDEVYIVGADGFGEYVDGSEWLYDAYDTNSLAGANDGLRRRNLVSDALLVEPSDGWVFDTNALGISSISYEDLIINGNAEGGGAGCKKLQEDDASTTHDESTLCDEHYDEFGIRNVYIEVIKQAGKTLILIAPIEGYVSERVESARLIRDQLILQSQDSASYLALQFPELSSIERDNYMAAFQQNQLTLTDVYQELGPTYSLKITPAIVNTVIFMESNNFEDFQTESIEDKSQSKYGLMGITPANALLYCEDLISETEYDVDSGLTEDQKTEFLDKENNIKCGMQILYNYYDSIDLLNFEPIEDNLFVAYHYGPVHIFPTESENTEEESASEEEESPEEETEYTPAWLDSPEKVIFIEGINHNFYNFFDYLEDVSVDYLNENSQQGTYYNSASTDFSLGYFGDDFFIAPLSTEDSAYRNGNEFPKCDKFNYPNIQSYESNWYPARWRSVHRGLDIYPNKNSARAISIADGEIVKVTSYAIYQKIMNLDEDHFLTVVYGHVTGDSSLVGTQVDKGQEIGTLQLTTNTGAHIHLEVYFDKVVSEAASSSKWLIDDPSSCNNNPDNPPDACGYNTQGRKYREVDQYLIDPKQILGDYCR